MSRIAFVSCARIPYWDDPIDSDPPCNLDASGFDQPVWEHLLAQHIQNPFRAMLFLGDQVYSDYGLTHGGGNRPVADNWPPSLFHRVLYAMYSAQYNQVPAFKNLMQRLHDDGVEIGMTWDDHDFGYNNGCGTDSRFANKLASAKILFEQFLCTLKAMPPNYPPVPAIPLNTPTIGIEQINAPISLAPDVEIVMLDGRFYRDTQVGNGAKLLGDMQWDQLRTKLLAVQPGHLLIVCLGSPYSKTAQSWASNGSPYAHFDEFTALANEKHIIFLTGDIHRNKLIAHNGFTEIFSSGAHLPNRFFLDFPFSPKNKHRFGVLDIDDDGVDVKLYADNKIEISKTISRATGLPI